MELVSFPRQSVDWIRNGICTAKFSLNINGALFGYFSSERGLRQGDLISRYLSLLAMEVLSITIIYAAHSPTFEYYPIHNILVSTYYILR